MRLLTAVPVLIFSFFLFSLPRCCCKLQMVVNKGKSPPSFFCFFLGLYARLLQRRQGANLDCGESLRLLWIITLRKQLAKVLNWKISKQPHGLSKPMKEYLRVKISFVFWEIAFSNQQSCLQICAPVLAVKLKSKEMLFLSGKCACFAAVTVNIYQTQIQRPQIYVT